ncbi:Swarming motility protein YbiA [Shimia sp. SK013]|uniref:NADAR family protein n=1 Tax=Shimia sp. SK013 TaxID=1389006 RepID=UPI0006B4F1F3|nr:NADAR family protein [Shimia sp. SK013]KPA22067.1 Swarming motility protein YbiA [Shimia sp. SK013]
MNSTDGKFHFYWSGPFSQWQRSEFELGGVSFVTAEQAMMYSKAILFDDEETAALILEATDPGRQKALGRRVGKFSEVVWNDSKYEIVYRINLEKFRQNKGLRRKLFQTGERKLVEASPVDTIWGIGLEASVANLTPEAHWPGQNLLGDILTKVRDELRATFPDEIVQISSNS